MKDLIFKLSGTHGVSGSEDSVAKLCSDELSKYSEVNIDKMGNLIARFKSSSPKKHILLDAHIDQIGLIVTNVMDNGFLKVSSCGGVDTRVLKGSTVIIHGKRDIYGIVSSTPPHLLEHQDKPESLEDLFIDTSLSKDELCDIVSLGDRISLFSRPMTLLNNRIAAKSLDNRAGVLALIRCAELMGKSDFGVDVTILLSVQEETGELGAHTAPFDIHPDEAIVVDVSFASQPGVSKHKSGELAGGPMVGISPVLSKDISDTLISLCKKHDIDYQLEIMGSRTGTNADAISVTKSGIKTGLVSIPERNMHTAVEVVCIDDIENTARLLFEYIKNGGADIE